MRMIYTLLLTLAAPFVFVWLMLRSRRQTGEPDAWRERLGRLRLASHAPLIWIHAASLGEVQAAAPLVDALATRYPQYQLLITTFTATARRRAHERFGDRATVSLLPYDLPGCVRCFVDTAGPMLAVFVETELWPNLYRTLAHRQVPLLLVSARLSARAFPRYRRLRALIRPALQAVLGIAAQTRIDAERFVALGAAADKVSVMGNLKFDSRIAERVAERGAALRQALGARPLWVAGSTRPGEEQVLLEAFGRIRETLPNATLVLAPRHPERAAAIAELASAAGFTAVLRSDHGADVAVPVVLIVDGVGELLDFYAAADVVFVGGTIAEIGGHNILEPAALGRPVIAGPHIGNWRELADAMSKRGGLQIAADAGALAQAVIKLLQDDTARNAAGAAALAVVEENRGALERALAIIDQFMPPNHL